MKELNLHIPKSWGDLSEKQILFVSWLFCSNCSEYELLLRAMLEFTGMQYYPEQPIRSENYGSLQWFVKDGDTFTLDMYQVRELMEACRFLLNSITVFAPVAQIQKSYPANQYMYDATLRQYVTADNFFHAYSHTLDASHLNQLVASIYLRKKQEFDDHKVAERAKYFANVATYVKYTVYMYFAGLKDYLAKEYPKIFAKGSSKTSMKEQLNTMLRNLTNGDVTKREDVLNTNLHDALSELNSLKAEVDEQKRKMKKHNV